MSAHVNSCNSNVLADNDIIEAVDSKTDVSSLAAVKEKQNAEEEEKKRKEQAYLATIIPSVRVTCGSCYLPKVETLRPEGEDAHFVCIQEQTIGIADGVGGWKHRGVDAGKYARELMRHSEVSVRYQHAINEGVVNPRQVLEEAYGKTQSQGSSTACIATLQNGSVLHFVNVGDSGVMVFRKCKFLYRSPSQQRRFNHPYQLGNSRGCDNPSAAREIRIQVYPEDVIVLGTDGLFDNMYPNEMEKVLVENTKESRVEPHVLARVLADSAFHRSKDQTFFSPYEKASKEAGKRHTGGKIDDITVVVGYVTASSSVLSGFEDIFDRPLEIISDSIAQQHSTRKIDQDVTDLSGQVTNL